MFESMGSRMKGLVKVELFDENGLKIHEEIKKNKIVNEAHELVGYVMANPGQKIEGEEKELFPITNADHKVFLNRAEVKNKAVFEIDIAATETVTSKALPFEDGEWLKAIKKVRKKSNLLRVYQAVHTRKSRSNIAHIKAVFSALRRDRFRFEETLTALVYRLIAQEVLWQAEIRTR